MIATAHLALITGYMSFDVTDHDAARRLWMIGLGLARDCEHPLGHDLTVYLLHDMAVQAVHLGRPDEALKLVHIGQAAAVGAHPVSASTASALSGELARAHAARGDAQACDRTLHQAVEGFGPDRARSRALHLFDLAGAHAIAGDIDTAVSVGHQAVDAVIAVHSPRAYDRLRVLHTVLAPLHTSATVA